MDWVKTKTILIISFLAVDIYLACLLFYVPAAHELQTSVSPDDLEALARLTQHFNIKLEAAPLPLAVEPLPLLEGADISLDEEIIHNWVGPWLGQGAKEAKEDNALLFIKGDKKLLFKQEQAVFYTVEYIDAGPIAAGGLSSPAEASALAWDFLAEHLGPAALDAHEVIWSAPAPEEGSFWVEICRLHGGYPLFSDSYRLLLEDGHVKYFIAHRAPVGKAGPKQALISAEQAIKRYLASLPAPPEEMITIYDLRLGYAATAGQTACLEPVWRFLLRGAEQEELYIPALAQYW